MPFFPAIAILTAVGLGQPASLSPVVGRLRRLWTGLAVLLWSVGALILTLGLPFLPIQFGDFQLWYLLPFIGGLLVLRGAWKLWHDLPPLSVLPMFLLGALLIFPPSFAAILPRLDIAWPSREVAGLLRQQPPGELVSVGFSEPSLAFLNGTRTKMVNVQGAVSALKESDFRYLLLEKRQKQQFMTLAPGQLDRLQLIKSFASYNYSKGKRLNFELYAKP